ncbi:MAG: PilZ domain-containing protein [Pseudomonas sp.]|uniref:PilZ domain-containing protein n=1 Tax=Pseudomonas sp. TaxID=306 RepID=UPI003BB786D6
MSKKSLLNNEELNYIQQIFGNSLAISGLPTPSFRVDGGAAANAILTGLGKHAELHLDAQFGDQHLRFPLQLVEDEFHALHLELGAPGIFQQGDVQRSWRLNLEQPLCLLHKNGRMSDLCVHEISPSGVLIESTGALASPESFTLWLPLPDQEPIKLRGRCVRRINSELTAFRLDLLPGSHGERLRHFIFQQHRLQHPQLQQSA